MSSTTTPLKVEKTPHSSIVVSAAESSNSSKDIDEAVSTSSNSKSTESKATKQTAKENADSKMQADDSTITKIPARRSSVDGSANRNTINELSSNRNPLTESVSNSETNRKNWLNSTNSVEAKSQSIQKQSSNNNTSNVNNNSKLRSRPAKKSTSPTHLANTSAGTNECGWCREKKIILKYVLPTLSGENLEFCSEMCIGEFRKAVKRGACNQCGNAIRPMIAPNQEYCSTFCMNKAHVKSSIDDVSSTTGSKRSSPSNNQHTLARSFQYETFHVFNWDDYLIVNMTLFISYTYTYKCSAE